jgi:iron(III) transport system ATP-binding protein
MNKANAGSLEVKNLSKRFGETVAVNDVSLITRPGELLAVVGPSGCGKTTLLRSVAGLERPDSGLISLGGTVVFSASPLLFVPANQRRIGMVFQNYALWPHMDVFHNVAYPLRVQKVARSEQSRPVIAALAQVCMAGYEKRYPHQLSGGEQQRIALARALVTKPRILLLDEPLSNLDAHLREEMGDEIRRIQQETSLTVIHVTHDQVEAMTLADRIVVMDKGRVMQVGSPEEVYRRPENQFVAGFMGVSNLLRCTLTGRNGHTTAVLPNGDALGIGTIVGPAAGTVTLSIRPEDILVNSVRDGAVRCGHDTGGYLPGQPGAMPAVLWWNGIQGANAFPSSFLSGSRGSTASTPRNSCPGNLDSFVFRGGNDENTEY